MTSWRMKVWVFSFVMIILGIWWEGTASRLQAAEPTVDDLKVSLRSPDVKVRKKAATDLGKTQSRDAVAPLLSAAQDSDVSVREEVVKSLGLLKDQSAITMLLSTLKDSAESVREESIIALVNLYADRQEGFVFTRVATKVYKTINPFSDAVGHDPTVVEPHIRVSSVVADAIAERLADPSPAIRIDAAKALGILKAEAQIPKLLEAMKTGDANLRIAVLRSLYKIRNPAVDAEIMPYLNDSNKDVRDETILTLGLFRSRKALPELQKIYDQNSESKLRLKALEAISLIGDRSSMELFQRNLRDPDAHYRQFAAEGLARIAEPSLVEEVSRTALSEKKFSTQLALSLALYRMGRREYLDKLVEALNQRMYHEQVEAYFIEMGKPISPELLRYLNHKEPRVRERLCAVLGLIGDQTAVDKLKPLLNDPDKNVVSEAALAIRRLGAS